MARLNVHRDKIYTHEGAVAQHINAELQLRRSVMACMLWENTFYEDGTSIADRISAIIPNVAAEKVSAIAIETRSRMKLRHIPLLLVREMARLKTHRHFVAQTLAEVIQRPDELTEFIALYWKDGRQPLSAQVKKGLAQAFTKFDRYQLSKYDRGDKIKLRDVLFLCHAKPKSPEQTQDWKDLVDGQLEPPDTWEVALSGGQNKRETWERLITEGKLGGLALLRNLRNIQEVGVSESVVFAGLQNMRTDRILPFRFIAAAKYAPQWEAQIEPVMLKCLEGKEKLGGKTALVVDGSGSMFGTQISRKSEIDRFEAAAALAIMAREVCENVRIVVFSNNAFIVPARHGFALRDAIRAKAQGGRTNTQNGINLAAQKGYDRIVILTDEQSHQVIRNPMSKAKAYVINVSCEKNGIGYGEWTHIDGWSEAVLDYIVESEKAQ